MENKQIDKDSDESLTKVAIQTVAVYDNFTGQQSNRHDADLCSLLISGVLGHYHTKIGIELLEEILEAHLISIREIKAEIMGVTNEQTTDLPA